MFELNDKTKHKFLKLYKTNMPQNINRNNIILYYIEKKISMNQKKKKKRNI